MFRLGINGKIMPAKPTRRFQIAKAADDETGFLSLTVRMSITVAVQIFAPARHRS
jgi:hypothetical protein